MLLNKNIRNFVMEKQNQYPGLVWIFSKAF
jgi:hypothetical protein